MEDFDSKNSESSQVTFKNQTHSHNNLINNLNNEDSSNQQKLNKENLDSILDSAFNELNELDEHDQNDEDDKKFNYDSSEKDNSVEECSNNQDTKVSDISINNHKNDESPTLNQALSQAAEQLSNIDNQNNKSQLKDSENDMSNFNKMFEQFDKIFENQVDSNSNSQSQFSEQEILNKFDECMRNFGQNSFNGNEEEGGIEGFESIAKDLFGDFGSKDDSSFKNLSETVSKAIFSKEVMQQPIEDIIEKYPRQLDSNENKINEEERRNYKNQLDCFKRLSKAFKCEPVDQVLISKLMDEMQKYGQPPKELIDGILSMPGLNNENVDLGFDNFTKNIDSDLQSSEKFCEDFEKLMKMSSPFNFDQSSDSNGEKNCSNDREFLNRDNSKASSQEKQSISNSYENEKCIIS